MTKEELRELIKSSAAKAMENYLNAGHIISIYPFGSVVYGTSTPESDIDYILVVGPDFKYKGEYKDGNNDFNIYTEEEWKEKANRFDVDYLESINGELSPEELDYDKIRASISHTASNSWVKGKKKLTIEKDYAPYIGKKSIWHSLRILMFGIQIMKYGKIIDYKEANYLYADIVKNENNDWEYYKEKYQPLYNKLHTEFKLAHKGAMTNGRSI